MTTVEITSIFPWVDFMPCIGTGTGELMCIIKFNLNVSSFKIKSIVLSDGITNYSHDITTNDKFKYEQRKNEVVIRRGPRWLQKNVTAYVTIIYNSTEYVIKSQPKYITETS